MIIKRVIQFDAFSLKYLKIGSRKPNNYLKELTLHLESYKRGYWYIMSDYDIRCISDMTDSVDRWWDIVHDGDIELFSEAEERLIKREDLRYNMAHIAREMILRGEY